MTITATPIAVTISTPSVTRPAVVPTGDNATSLFVVPTYPFVLERDGFDVDPMMMMSSNMTAPTTHGHFAVPLRRWC